MAADVRSFNANFVARLHSGAAKAVASKEAARRRVYFRAFFDLRPSLFVRSGRDDKHLVRK
jgi:hypothetical protein